MRCSLFRQNFKKGFKPVLYLSACSAGVEVEHTSVCQVYVVANTSIYYFSGTPVGDWTVKRGGNSPLRGYYVDV